MISDDRMMIVQAVFNGVLSVDYITLDEIEYVKQLVEECVMDKLIDKHNITDNYSSMLH